VQRQLRQLKPALAIEQVERQSARATIEEVTC